MSLSELFCKHTASKTSDYGTLLDKILSPYIDKKGKLLEIGLLHGGSMKAFQEFLPKFSFYSIDIKPLCHLKDVSVFTGNQADKDFLLNVANKVGPLSIVIDDGGHWDHMQKPSFEVLFSYVKLGGIYIIEDLQVAKERCSIGPNMVQYIKQLSHKNTFYPTQRSKIDLCVIYK